MRRRKIRKFADRQRTENSSKTEATLIPVDRRGERANFRRTENKEQRTDRQRIQLQRPLLSPVDRRGERANL